MFLKKAGCPTAYPAQLTEYPPPTSQGRPRKKPAARSERLFSFSPSTNYGNLHLNNIWGLNLKWRMFYENCFSDDSCIRGRAFRTVKPAPARRYAAIRPAFLLRRP